MSRAPFIVVEGPDGAGKSTQSRALAVFLGAEWRCFPDRRTPIGGLIDQHLKNEWWAENGGPGREHAIDALVFQGLQLANRIEVQPDIIETLDRGVPVVCDRYWGSGYAYGSADGLDPEYMLALHRGILKPTICILLDLPLEVAIERLRARGGPAERYERNLVHARAVAERYRELWARQTDLSKSWVIVDANADAVVVQARLRLVVRQLLAVLGAETP